MGKQKLAWKKLEVLTEIEATLNNRPLTYIKEDIQFPVLTPNLLFLGQTPVIPTKILQILKINKKKTKVYTKMQKSGMEERNEYLLREKYNLKHKMRELEVKVNNQLKLN